jgi:hypothetical protein
MQTTERRRQRTHLVSQALRYQLAACCADGKIAAMVVADGDGLALASSGDVADCEELAARMVHIGARIAEFRGTLLGDGRRWDVQMRKIQVDDVDLLVCAIGGSPEQRERQVQRGATGALRILGASS